MEQLQLFVTENWPSIAFVAGAILVMLILLKRGYTKQVKETLFYLVCQAELEFGGGTGELKYAAVTMWIYETLPTIARIFYPPKTIDRLIEQAVARMKEYLQENEKARVLVQEPCEVVEVAVCE